VPVVALEGLAFEEALANIPELLSRFFKLSILQLTGDLNPGLSHVGIKHLIELVLYVLDVA